MFYSQPQIYKIIRDEDSSYVETYCKISKSSFEDIIFFKAQLYKQLLNDIKNGGANVDVDELCGFINSKSGTLKVKNGKKEKEGKENKKKKKNLQNKKSKNAKARKNSDDIAIDKFIKCINNHSVPFDKVVKIKTCLNNELEFENSNKKS